MSDTGIQADVPPVEGGSSTTSESLARAVSTAGRTSAATRRPLGDPNRPRPYGTRRQLTPALAPSSSRPHHAVAPKAAPISRADRKRVKLVETFSYARVHARTSALVRARSLVFLILLAALLAAVIGAIFSGVVAGLAVLIHHASH